MRRPRGGRARPQRRRECAASRAGVIRHAASSSTRFGGGKHLVLVGAARELGDRAAAAQHDDAVAEAEQLGHLARGDQHAEALAARARGCGRRSRPWRRRRRRASARRAAAAAGSPSTSLASTTFCWLPPDSAPTASSGSARAHVEGSGSPRRASRRLARPATSEDSGDTLRRIDQHEIAADAVAQHQAAAAPVVGDEGRGLPPARARIEVRRAGSRRRSRPTPRPAPGAGRAVERRQAARCGRRP